MFFKTMDLLHLTISMTTAEASTQTLEAETILNKYIEVIGGRPAIEKINSKISETTTSVPGKKTKIKTTTFMKRPDKAYAVAELKALGKTIKSEGGRNGDIVWQIVPGALGSKKRILSGQEKELRLADMAFDTAAVSWRDYYKSINLVGEEEVDGKPCYKVAFTPFYQTNMDTICLFDKETFLIRKIIKDTFIKDKLAQAEIYLSDYKNADDIMVPHTLKRFAEGEDELFITIDSIQSDVDIPDSKFELPKKIKALAEKQG